MLGLFSYNIDHIIEQSSEEDLSVILSNIDIAENINEEKIVKSKKLQRIYPIFSVSKQKLNRILIRMLDRKDVEFVNNLSLKNVEVNTRQIRTLIKRYPEMILRFNIDLTSISDEDAYTLLRGGNMEIFDRIDIKKRKFTPLMQYHVSKSYDFKIEVIEKMETKKFDGFQTKEALKTLGHEHIHMFDIEKMKMTDWINLATYDNRSEILKLFTPARFRNESIRWMVDMAIASNSDRIYDEILKRDLKELSPYDWERLTKERPEQFTPLCDLSKYDPFKN